MRSIALAALLLGASTLHAQAPVDPTGHWKGLIEIPNASPLEFQVDFSKNTKGDIVGAVAAGVDAAALPLLSITIRARTVTFYARTDQPFQGQLSESGAFMSGTARLSGYSLPFSMSRTGDAHIEPDPTSAAVTPRLEGVWKGLLKAGGAEYHLILTIANQPGGTALAHSVSVDEGGLNVPVVVTEDGSRVGFTAKGVTSSYAGTMNASGTEITGIWTQRATSFPMTFTRAATTGK